MKEDSITKILFWVIVVVLISMSLLMYRSLSNYDHEVRSIRHSNRILKTLEEVLSSLKDAETGHRGYQLTRDSGYLEPYFLSLTILPQELKDLESLVRKDSLQSQRVDSLQNLTNVQFLIIDNILANAKKSALYMDRYESDLLREERANMDRIRAIGNRISVAEESLSRERELSETDLRNIAPIYLLLYALAPMAGLVYLFTRLLDGLQKKNKAEKDLRSNIIELRKEAAMREFTQKTLRNVVDNALSGIMAFQSIRNKQNEVEDFSWILANTLTVQISGHKEEELVGKRLLDIMPENKTDGTFELYRDTVESGNPKQFEHHRKVNGRDEWLYITVVKLEDGCVVTFTDITERKTNVSLLEERALQLNEAEFLARIGSWKWTEKDDLVWSDGLFKILSKSPGDFKPVWNSFLDNVHPDDVGLVTDFVQGLVGRAGAFNLDYRIQIEEQTHFLSLSVRSFQGDEGQPLYILGTVMDITERKVYENQLKQYTAELQRSNEDLEQFAYIASHDLQEPLRKIRAFGDRLSTKFHNQLEETGVDYINRMQQAAARMQLLIEDILAFSRISRSVGEFEPLDMAKLMVEVVDDLDAQIKRERGNVKIGPLANIAGDRVQIKRLFQNLISNGLKFHKPDEKPFVEVTGRRIKNHEVAELFGKSLPNKEYTCFFVKDNGIGFDEQYKDKIFNIFQRLHGRNEYEGTGIGLSICRKIVMNHKGQIFTKSEEKVGSEFIVILPIG